MSTFPTPDSRYTPPPDARRLLLAEELSEIAERAESFTGATGVMIALKRRNELVVRTSIGIAPEVGACIPWPSGVTGLSVTTKKPQTCASADAEAQLEAVFRALGVRSVLSVPVQWDGEVRGVLAVLSQMPETFNRTHVAILMTLRDVIANKLSLCELPAEAPPAPDAEQVFEIDADSLLSAPAPAPSAAASTQPTPAAPKAAAAPQPTLAAPKPAALAPPTPRATPVTPAVPVAPALPQSAAPTQAAIAEPKLPAAVPALSQPPAKPLAELIKQPAEAPVEMSPDVLCPGEDPTKYGRLPKPKPVVSPVVAPVATATDSAPAMFAAYRAPVPSSRKGAFPIFAGAAAVVMLGLAIGFYVWHKPAAPANPSPASQETAAPAPSLIAVPLPKSAGEQPPVTVTSQPAAPSTTAAKHEEAKPAAEEPKRTPEQVVLKPVPALQVAPAKPLAKVEEPMEAPSLTASVKALPDLPNVPVSAASVAVRNSALVPAKLVQGRSPSYPDAARRMGVSGVVKLNISISAAGKVTEVRVLTGHPLLRQASINAVSEWVYRPAYLDGNPVASTAEVSLRFNSSR